MYEAVDPPQKIVRWKVMRDRELLEQRTLRGLLRTHHRHLQER